jgi:hypothetical protein
MLAISSVALLLAACSAAPGSSEEAASSASEAVNDPNVCAADGYPFTRAVYKRVWIEPDMGRGYYATVMQCVPMTGPPVAPPGGYPSPWDAMTPDQLALFTPTPPPSALTGCTAGLTVGNGYVSLFLCPSTQVLPTDDPSQKVVTPNDPLVGPLLVSGWEFVQTSRPLIVSNCPPGSRGCILPGPGCGAACSSGFY